MRATTISACAYGQSTRGLSKGVEGRAMEEYQKSLQLHLNDAVLRYYQIEATRALANSPNAKLIYLNGGARPPDTWLDLRGGQSPRVPVE